MNAGDADARFLVAGEYLSMPRGFVRARVDAMWNDEFQYAPRRRGAALVGEIPEGDADFEAAVRKIVACRGGSRTTPTRPRQSIT